MSFTIDLSNPVVLSVLGIFSIPVLITIFILYIIFINKILNYIFNKVSYNNSEFFSFLGNAMIIISQIIYLVFIFDKKVG